MIDDVVYTSNREGKVFCFGSAEGDVRWSRDLRADMELEPPTWGFSASPLVVDDRVVLNMDRVIVLDRNTGEDVWVSEKGYGKAYSTPTAFELAGQSYLAVLSGSGLTVLERAAGSEVAHYGWSKEPEIYPMTPVVIDDRIFISAGYDRGCAMLQFKDGQLEELWSSRVMRNKMSGCVLWEGHLFGFDESILKCIDLDGKERWRERGMGTGSMTIAGGRLVVLSGRGQIIVAEANPDEYVELSRRDVLADGTAWSTPVLSNGRIYCRSSLGEMACLDYSATSDEAVAVESSTQIELPSAAQILARHVAAMRGARALEEIRSVSMKGESDSLINTVRTGEIELAWDREIGFTWSDASGLQFGFNTEVGWMLQPRSAPEVLSGEPLDALRETGSFTRLFDPASAYRALSGVEATVFEGRDCFAVRATTPESYERLLYFRCGNRFVLRARWRRDPDVDGRGLPRVRGRAASDSVVGLRADQGRACHGSLRFGGLERRVRLERVRSARCGRPVPADARGDRTGQRIVARGPRGDSRRMA